MIVRNKKTDVLENIKNVNIKYNGTFSDIISHSTAKFLYENTDPKIFFLDLIDKDGNPSVRQYNIVNTGNLHGLLADIRFRLVRTEGYTVKRLRTYYKPKKMQEDEQKLATNGIIQDPVTYTIIFNDQSTETNE